MARELSSAQLHSAIPYRRSKRYTISTAASLEHGRVLPQVLPSQKYASLRKLLYQYGLPVQVTSIILINVCFGMKEVSSIFIRCTLGIGGVTTVRWTPSSADCSAGSSWRLIGWRHGAREGRGLLWLYSDRYKTLICISWSCPLGFVFFFVKRHCYSYYSMKLSCCGFPFDFSGNLIFRVIRSTCCLILYQVPCVMRIPMHLSGLWYVCLPSQGSMRPRSLSTAHETSTSSNVSWWCTCIPSLDPAQSCVVSWAFFMEFNMWFPPPPLPASPIFVFFRGKIWRIKIFLPPLFPRLARGYSAGLWCGRWLRDFSSRRFCFCLSPV